MALLLVATYESVEPFFRWMASIMMSQQLNVESSGDCWYPEAATGSERSLSTGSLGSSGSTSRRARPRAPGLTSTLTSPQKNSY